MKLILFSKAFKDRNIKELIELAHGYGLDGYDFCVRPEYPVNPDNVADKLPEAASLFAKDGLSIQMVTGNFDLIFPDHPTARPILSAMDKADIRLLKMGYFFFNPGKQDYWQEVDKIRTAFEGWQKLGREYNVKICYHTHSSRCMGFNASALSHLINGFDPRYIGAYIDTAHMAIEGEEFCFGIDIIKKYLSIVALKDVLLTREAVGDHGRKAMSWVTAGNGMVDWTAVFSDLRRVGYKGPLSIHCEFSVPEAEFMNAVKREVEFFRNKCREL